MKFIETSQGNVIFLNGQYYVVNELTFNLLKLYFDKKNISEISEELGIEESKIQLMYNEISNQIKLNKNFDKPIKFHEPLKVQWKITNQCNLKCKHCYEGEKTVKQLSCEQINNIFEKLINSNIMQLTITGGEALLVNNLAMNGRRCLDRGIMLNIFTNGLLLDRFINELDEVKNKKLLSFEISVDGAKNQHDYIRGNGNYDKTISNISYAISKGYKIITNTVVNGVTKKSVIPMMRELYQLGVSSIQLSNLMIQGWAEDNKDELYISREELDKLYKDIAKNINFNFNYADISNNVYHSDSSGTTQVKGKNTWKCCAGEARITIDFNGDVLLCPLCQKFSIGNINELSLNEIWNNPDKQRYVKQLRDMNKGRHVCFVYDQNVSK